MDQSFYYFFSATPQVLGAVLALFGVFVIFKVQSLVSTLKGIAQNIVDEGQELFNTPGVGQYVDFVAGKSQLDEISKAIDRSDIEGIKSLLELFNYQQFNRYKTDTFRSLRHSDL